jgi:hypothetical protein
MVELIVELAPVGFPNDDEDPHAKSVSSLGSQMVGKSRPRPSMGILFGWPSERRSHAGKRDAAHRRHHAQDGIQRRLAPIAGELKRRR